MLPLSARAEGVSADIELLRHTLGRGALPGLDSPDLDPKGTLRLGGFLQYARDPLILYEKSDELGAIIDNRTTLQLGLAWDFSDVAGLRVSVPVALQWGTDVPEFARDGAVAGDAFVGARLRVIDKKVLDLGLRADVGLPTGSRAAWMGEDSFRAVLGPLAAAHIGPFDVMTDLAFVARREVITPIDLTLGSELLFGLGGRYHLWPDKASVSVAWVGRGGLGAFGQKGAENPSELVTVAQLLPRSDLQLDFGVGKGLAEGYGTSEFRAFTALTWIKRPRPPEPPPPLIIPDVPPDVPEPVVITPDPPEPEWEEEELARVEGERIIIRDPIEFEFNTNRILPQSLPTLRYVAGLMNEDWQIGHLVIEGHASEEGSFVYNYDLSLRRANAIWEELIRSGVHPDRMSVRGMGEVVPRTEGTDEGSLADNRRVEFKIVRQYRMDEAPDDLRDAPRLPWNGDGAQVVEPKKPEPRERPKPTPKAGPELEEFFDQLDTLDGDPPDPAPPAEERP